METKWRIGIVIPWFGRNLHGGAEQQAWQIALRLSQVGCQVRVLTTCSQSFLSSWHKNYYRPGVYQEAGLSIHRFALRKRHAKAFNHLVGQLLALPGSSFNPGQSPLDQKQEALYWRENIASADLIAYLKAEADAYDAFIFMPYLFPSSVLGIEAVSSKALLHACLHDECYAYLRRSAEAVSQCRALLFNSQGELLLAKKLYGGWISSKAFIIGEGIETTPAVLPLAAQAQPEPTLELPAKFVLCLGRRCAEKNTPFLLAAFALYKERYPASALQLILAGPGETTPLQEPLPPGTQDLGLVTDTQKQQLLAACTALVNPSLNESFSRVIFEAWSQAKPVLVHRGCLATYTAWQEAQQAGWSAQTEEELVAALQEIELSAPATLATLGARGQAYAAEAGSWDKAMQRYLACFRQLFNQASAEHRPKILYIFPCANPQAENQQLYLKDFLGSCDFLQKQGYALAILAPTQQGRASRAWQRALPAAVHPLPSPAAIAAWAPDYVIWQGPQPWPEAEFKVRTLACPKILRDLSPQPAAAAFLAHFELILGHEAARPVNAANASYHERQRHAWLPPFFPYHELQRQPLGAKALLAKKVTALLRKGRQAPPSPRRVLALLDVYDAKARSYLHTLGTAYYARYQQRLELCLPVTTSTTAANAGKRQRWAFLPARLPYQLFSSLPQEQVRVELFAADPHKAFAPQRYSASDAVLIFAAAPFTPWQVLAACDFGLSPVCVAAPYWASFTCTPLQACDHEADLNGVLELLAASPQQQRASLERCRYEYIPGQRQARLLQALAACKNPHTSKNPVWGSRQG